MSQWKRVKDVKAVEDGVEIV